MDFFWIYDLASWHLLLLCIAAFSLFSVFGALVFRTMFERKLGLSEGTNETVRGFLEVSGIFYGITLGLIAVGAYESYKDAQKIIASEAAALNSLYRDVAMLSLEPHRTELKITVRSYAAYLVADGWRLQKQGIVPKDTTRIIDRLEAQLVKYPLASEMDSVIFGQIMEQDNELGEFRRQRVSYVQSGLPPSIWYVLWMGAIIIAVLTWLLVIKNRPLDILINVLTGSLLGTLIFVIAVMDRPFRGEFCLTADPFQLLLDGVMMH